MPAAAPLLQIQALCQPAREAHAPESPRAGFDDVSFSIQPGEHVALLGARGAGKTALVRTVALIQKPEAGHVFFEGQEVTAFSGGRLRALRQRLQFVGGDPMYSLPPHATVREALLEPLEIHRLGSKPEQAARVEVTAARLELNPLLLDRKVSLLSAALRQRVAVARVLTLQPRLLVCDELTERLEPAAARSLLELASRAGRLINLGWLWTTSDPVLAHAFADRILYLQQGRLVAEPV